MTNYKTFHLKFQTHSHTHELSSKRFLLPTLLIALLLLLSTFSLPSSNCKAGENEEISVPSEFTPDLQLKFDEEKWRKLTEQGMTALNQKRYKSADSCFQAAVREASKAPCMSTFMIDSLVHSAEVYRLTGRKQEAKENFDQALELVGTLVADKCPLCKSEKESIPIIYGPHSDELDSWVKSKAAQLGDMTEVTTKGRKKRPAWYCKMCDQSY